LHGLQLFGATSTVNQTLNNNNVQSILFFPNYFPTFDNGTGAFNWNQLLTTHPVGTNDFD
jgi:hypothetical protein